MPAVRLTKAQAADYVANTKHVAFALLQVKDVNDELRVIEGIASTPTPDRMQDIVEPMGAKFKLPLPALLWHDSRQPIGNMTQAKPNKNGIPYVIQFARPGILQWVDDAWTLVKEGLVRAVSIGFNPLEWSYMEETGGIRFSLWEWLELSLVTIPANSEATIETIKSFDREQMRAKLGAARRVVRLDSTPVASGALVLPASVHAANAAATSTVAAPAPKAAATVTNKLHTFEGTANMAAKSIPEQISAFEAKRAANAARLATIVDKAGEEGRTLEEDEDKEYKSLASECVAIDEHLVRLKAHQELMAKSATPAAAAGGSIAVVPANALALAGGAGVGGVRGGVKWGEARVEKGTGFVRYAMAVCQAKGDSYAAQKIAKQWKDTTPEVALCLEAADEISSKMMQTKAAVAVGNSSDAAWGSPLEVYTNMASEFIEILRPQTIIGRIQGIRRVPFNISMPRGVSGTTSQWVGEGLPKPVSRMSFETITLGHSKVATIVVLTDELVRFSNPSAESVVQQDMIDSIVAFCDTQFIDPTVTASGTTRPASVTNGLPTHGMSGVTVAAVLADVATLMGSFVNANVMLKNGVWIMHPRTALYLSLLLSPLGTYQFPNINIQGGTFMGLPVITSASVPIDTGDDSYIILMDASEILLADDAGIQLDASREASLQIDGAPSSSPASQTSLWQNNLVGLRAERIINYRRRRDAGVALLKNVSY